MIFGLADLDTDLFQNLLRQLMDAGRLFRGDQRLAGEAKWGGWGRVVQCVLLKKDYRLTDYTDDTDFI